MAERGLQFRPGVFGAAGALLLTTGSLALCIAAGATAVRHVEDRAAAVLVCVVFALGTVFGLAALAELVTRRPMPRGVTRVVGLGLAAAFASVALSPAATHYGVGPIWRVPFAALAAGLVRHTLRLRRVPEPRGVEQRQPFSR